MTDQEIDQVANAVVNKLTHLATRMLCWGVGGYWVVWIIRKVFWGA
jgi:hypothetical protein